MSEISVAPTIAPRVEMPTVSKPVDSGLRGENLPETQSHLEPKNHEQNPPTEDEEATRVREELEKAYEGESADEQNQDLAEKDKEQINQGTETDENQMGGNEQSRPKADQPLAEKSKKKKEKENKASELIIDLLKQMLKALLVALAFIKLWLFSPKNPNSNEFSGDDLDLPTEAVQGPEKENLAKKLGAKGDTWKIALNKIRGIRRVSLATLAAKAEAILIEGTIPAIKPEDQDKVNKSADNKAASAKAGFARRRMAAATARA